MWNLPRLGAAIFSLLIERKIKLRLIYLFAWSVSDRVQVFTRGYVILKYMLRYNYQFRNLKNTSILWKNFTQDENREDFYCAPKASEIIPYGVGILLYCSFKRVEFALPFGLRKVMMMWFSTLTIIGKSISDLQREIYQV